MVICDACGACWHEECAVETSQPPIHDGPWVCLECRGRMQMQGCPDVSLDFRLSDYLWLGSLPASPEECDRVMKLAESYRARGRELERRMP